MEWPPDLVYAVVRRTLPHRQLFWFFDDASLQIGVRTQAEPIGEQEGI